MLKILQARFQQNVNRELPDIQAVFRKGRGTRDQIANIPWIMEKAREIQENIYFCFVDYAKVFANGRVNSLVSPKATNLWVYILIDKLRILSHLSLTVTPSSFVFYPINYLQLPKK